METSPKNAPWTPQRVVHELMAIWFGSVHAVSTTVTFAIHDLCLHPEYVEPLRKECEAQYADFEQAGTGLPLLDSFIKESARLTPVESRTIPHSLSTMLPLHVLITVIRKHPPLRIEAVFTQRWHTRQCWRLVLHACSSHHDQPC